MQAAPIPDGMPDGPSPSTRARDALSVRLSPGRQGYPPLTWPFRASRFPTPPSLRERRRSWEPGPGERGKCRDKKNKTIRKKNKNKSKTKARQGTAKTQGQSKAGKKARTRRKADR